MECHILPGRGKSTNETLFRGAFFKKILPPHRLPELEYGVRERHAALLEMFDANSAACLNIGEKVMELSSNLDVVTREQRGVDGWRREYDACLKGLAEDTGSLRVADETARARHEQLQKERDTLAHRMHEVALLRDDHRGIESRLESYLREESRNVERRLETRGDAVEAKLAHLERSLADAAESRRLLTQRLARGEQRSEDAIKSVAKLTSALETHATDADDCAADLEDLREQVTTMTQTTAPGYCQGCRLVVQDFDNKLFSVKQSICYLDQALKGREGIEKEVGEPEVVRAPSGVGEIARLQGRVDAIGAELEGVQAAMMSAETGHTHAVSASAVEMRTYVDEAVARVEAAVLSQVTNMVEHFVETKASQDSVDAISDKLAQILQRMSNIEDKMFD